MWIKPLQGYFLKKQRFHINHKLWQNVIIYRSQRAVFHSQWEQKLSIRCWHQDICLSYRFNFQQENTFANVVSSEDTLSPSEPSVLWFDHYFHYCKLTLAQARGNVLQLTDTQCSRVLADRRLLLTLPNKMSSRIIFQDVLFQQHRQQFRQLDSKQLHNNNSKKRRDVAQPFSSLKQSSICSQK